MTRYYLSSPRRFRRFWDGPSSVEFNGGRRWPVDVHVDEESFIIEAEVPGLTAEDLKIEILDDLVTLSAEMKAEENGKHETLLHEIQRTGEFSRKLRLPVPVDSSKAEAKVENGLLTVRIPKSEEARPKVIEVKAK